MIKYRRKQSTDPQKLKNWQRSISHFLLVEAVKAEAIKQIAASTSLDTTAAVRQVLTIFLKDSSIFFCIRIF